MDAVKLNSALKAARIYQPIILTLKKTSFASRGDLEAALKVKTHQAENLKIKVEHVDHQGIITISKTHLFKDEDAREFASVMARYLTTAEVRDIPDHHIKLTFDDEGKFLLTLFGGNKSMRHDFALFTDGAEKKIGLEAEIVSNHGGEITMRIEGDQDTALAFCQALASVVFQTELQI